jgi:uncharacterized repeat protein (TIGR02543 family)
MKNILKKLAVCMIAMTMLMPVRAVFAPDVSAEAASLYFLALVDKLNGTTDVIYANVQKTPSLAGYTPSAQTGYTFDGWNSEEDGSGITYSGSYTGPATANGHVTLYAKWIPNKYSIAFDGNGSTSGSMSSMTDCDYGSSYTLSANQFELPDYTFTGWNTKKDGSGTTYQDKASVKSLTSTDGGTVTLYAQWKPTEYDITYVLDGGTNNSANPSTYTGKEDIPLSDPTRTGYTFDGWYTSSTFSGTAISTIVNGHPCDLTLYAKWIPITYTVKFDGNAPEYTEGSMPDMKLEYGTASTLTANSYSFSGYTFGGWNTESDGSGTTYADKASVKNLTTTDGAIVTLYAGWYPNYYYLNLDGNGSTSGSYTGKYWGYTDVNYNLPANVYERTGYTFAGWNTNKDGSGTGFTDKQSIWGIAEYNGVTYSLYAQWTPVTYTITYQLNGGANDSRNPSSYTIESANISLNNPTRAGYTFGGWYSDSSLTTKVSSISKGSYGNKTLYAKWNLTTYTITYTLNGGTNDSANPASYDITQNVKLATPTKEGYYFAGWYSDKNLTTIVSSIKKGSTGNLTLYAKWNESTYDILFFGNGSTSGVMDDMESLTYSKSYKLTKNKFTRKGYKFIGWNTEWDGSGDSYKDGASVKKLNSEGGNTALYAQWKSLSNAITYVLNGGTNNAKNPSTYTSSKKVTLAKPTRAGYTFVGWYSNKKCTKKVTAIKKGSSGNKTFYAKWKANTYTIVFGGNGSTGGSMSSKKSLAYSKSYTLAKNKFTRTGYTFVGWNTKKNGKGTSYTDAEKVKGLVTKNKGKITLYAQWKANDYTITYELGGGANSAKNPDSYTYGKAVTLDSPTKDGYTFLGWYTDKNLSKKITSVSATTSGNLTLYAGWKKTVTTVTCPTCDGKKTVSCKKCDNGKVTCSTCGGNGFTIVPGQAKVDCTVCGATGKVDCTTCGGDGKAECSTCSGKGTITK